MRILTAKNDKSCPKCADSEKSRLSPPTAVARVSGKPEIGRSRSTTRFQHESDTPGVIPWDIRTGLNAAVTCAGGEALDEQGVPSTRVLLECARDTASDRDSSSSVSASTEPPGTQSLNSRHAVFHSFFARQTPTVVLEQQAISVERRVCGAARVRK